MLEKGSSYTLQENNSKVSINPNEGEHWRYHYDLLNRLVKVEQNGEVVANYKYDEAGLRLSKQTKEQTTYYIFNLNGQVIYEQEDTDYTEYLYVFNRHFARIDGNLLTEERTTYFYHTDHLGSTVLVTDELGQTVWSSEYTPFGQVAKDDPGFNKAIKFTGKDLDLETGLYYFNARWYDSDIGRFISEDPIKDGLNWYTYAISNPLMYVDPSGLKYIPLRERAEEDGYTVEWDSETSKASISRKGASSEYYDGDEKGSYIGSDGKMYVRDEAYQTDTELSNWMLALAKNSRGDVLSNLLYDSDLSVAELNRKRNSGIAIVYGSTHEYTVAYGMAKYSNTLTITIKPDPNSPWQLGTDGTVSLNFPHFKMGVKRGGEITIGNDNIASSYKYGDFGAESELGFCFMQEITNGDLKIKTSTQLLPSLSWVPFWNVAGGYVPMNTQKVEISDQWGYMSVESEMTYYIHRNFRDGMALVPIGVGVREFSSALKIIITESLYNSPLGAH